MEKSNINKLKTNDMSPLVTVVVMLYKNYGGLKDNIASIERQNYPRIELIVADDCSGDFDQEYVSGLINDCSRFENVMVYSNERNLGTVRNYNTAIKNSSGEITIPLSADDVFYDENVVSNIVDFLDKNNSNICYAKRLGSLSQQVYPSEDDISIINNGDEVLSRLCYSGLFSGATIYFRKKFWEELGTFDEQYFLMEDLPFSLAIYLKNYKIDFFDSVSIVYGEDGVTGHKGISPLIRKDLNVLFTNMISLLGGKVSKKCIRYLKFLRYKNKHFSFLGKASSALVFPIISFNRILHSLLLRLKKYNKDFYQFYLKPKSSN